MHSRHQVRNDPKHDGCRVEFGRPNSRGVDNQRWRIRQFPSTHPTRLKGRKAQDKRLEATSDPRTLRYQATESVSLAAQAAGGDEGRRSRCAYQLEPTAAPDQRLALTSREKHRNTVDRDNNYKDDTISFKRFLVSIQLFELLCCTTSKFLDLLPVELLYRPNHPVPKLRSCMTLKIVCFLSLHAFTFLSSLFMPMDS